MSLIVLTVNYDVVPNQGLLIEAVEEGVYTYQTSNWQRQLSHFLDVNVAEIMTERH